MRAEPVRVQTSALEFVWHPGPRLAVGRSTPHSLFKGRDAEVLVEALERWIGEEPKPLAILVDLRDLRDVDAEYRATTSRFVKRHPGRVRVACFHIGPVLRIMADMFRIAGGVQLAAFASEEDARAWLRTKGVAA